MDLVDTLYHGLQMVWGTSCIHFSYEEDIKTITIEEYFSHRKIPIMFAVCQPCSLSGDNGHKVLSKICPLYKIRVKKAEKK